MMKMEEKKKKSMSVMEMRRLLGLGKTESYYILKKGYFETRMVGGKLRVMTDSFEAWYRGQFHYRKVSGEPPGADYFAESYSIEEICEMLLLTEGVAKEMIKAQGIEKFYVGTAWRIPKDAFEAWYDAQNIYLKREKREELSGVAISMPDAARLLGISRKEMYGICNQADFEYVQVGRRRWITKESFADWYREKYGKELDERGDNTYGHSN